MTWRGNVTLVAIAAAVSWAYVWIVQKENEEEVCLDALECTDDKTLPDDLEGKTIPELIAILEQCEGSLVVEAAVIRLGNLAAFTPLQHHIAKCGGIAVLLDRLSDMDCTQRCASVILTTLANLTVNDTNHIEIASGFNLEMFRAWYIEGDVETKRACARLLKNLTMWESHAAELLALDILSPLARDLFQLNDLALDEIILQCWLNMIEPRMELKFLKIMLAAIESGQPLTERSKETTTRILLWCTKRDEASDIFGEQVVQVLNSLEYFLDTTDTKSLPGHDELWEWYLNQTTLEKSWET